MWRFWLVNLLLLLLYGWTWGDETPITVRVGEDGVCEAIAAERSLEIACPNIAGGRVGLFNGKREPGTFQAVTPLDWLAPRSSWADAELVDADGQLIWTEPFREGVGTRWQAFGGQWLVVAGELRAPETAAVLLRREPLAGGVTFSASLRRAEEAAGVLLLEANGVDGWLFLVSGRNRNGVWWRWEGGKPAEPLVGIPYQKPLLAQVQSFLRGVLRGQQGALLLLGIGYGLRIAYRVLRIDERVGKRTMNGRYAIRNMSFLLIGLILLGSVCKLQGQKDGRNYPHSAIVVCPLFVAGRQATELLEAVNCPLDSIAKTINGLIKWAFLGLY